MQFKLKTLFLVTFVGSAIALIVASQPNRGMIDIDITGRLQVEQPRLIFGKRIEKTFEAPIIRVIDADTVELLLEDKTTPNCRLESKRRRPAIRGQTDRRAKTTDQRQADCDSPNRNRRF